MAVIKLNSTMIKTFRVGCLCDCLVKEHLTLDIMNWEAHIRTILVMAHCKKRHVIAESLSIIVAQQKKDV